jgi:hypothetical protein
MYPSNDDPLGNRLIHDAMASLASVEELYRLSGTSRTLGMQHDAVSSAEINRVISRCDPLQMGDIRRGAQQLLRRLNECPQETAMTLQMGFGVQDITDIVSQLRAQCKVILMGGGGHSGLRMPDEGSGRMGMGMGRGASIHSRSPGAVAGGAGFGGFGGMLGRMPGAIAPGMSPSMANSRAGAQADPYGAMGNQPRHQSPFGGHHLSANRGPHTEYGNRPFNHAGGRADESRQRGDPRSNAGAREESWGPSMYGGFFGLGRF